MLDGVQISMSSSTFETDMYQPMVTYLTQANVPVQRTQRRNAFIATRGDNTAMRPLAKLLWTLVSLCRMCIW